MTYIGTKGNFLCLDNEGFPLNIKIKDVFKLLGKLYINHNSPNHKAVMIDLQTKQAILSQ
jgi:hypothetical protein